MSVVCGSLQKRNSELFDYDNMKCMFCGRYRVFQKRCLLVVFIIIVTKIIMLESTSAHEFAVAPLIRHTDLGLYLLFQFLVFILFFDHVVRMDTELTARTQFVLRYGGMVDNTKCVKEF